MKMNQTNLQTLAANIGAVCRGGECFELVGDVGAGKTTFTKALALGLEVEETVQSPTFTISREYPARNELTLVHYDLYRLQEAGLIGLDLEETVQRDDTVTVIEWGETVRDVLPNERISVTFTYDEFDENLRNVTFDIPRTAGHIKEIL